MGQIGIGCETRPYVYDGGYYSSIEEYEYSDKEPIGLHLVFSYSQPVVDKKQWILNPDLVVALGLIKEGNSWVRPEENFVEVVREVLDDNGNHVLIEIKRAFLIDYLAARNLTLRLSYYRQRVENVQTLEDSDYSALENTQEERDNGRYELLIRNIEGIFGGTWASMRVWRTDVDVQDDAPIMGQENDENTEYESGEGYHGGYEGVRVEGEFWRDEWIHHNKKSIRVRGDLDDDLPNFIVETDSTRKRSHELNNEDIGRWLWFRSSVVNELLSYRGFSLWWYTKETGYIQSTSMHRTHFGINGSDYITVYAYDIARLNSWEQHIWASHNVVPDGKVSTELLMSQVEAQPASTRAPEVNLFQITHFLEKSFYNKYKLNLFLHDVNEEDFYKIVSRFSSKDEASLLRLAKEMIRFFSERLNKGNLKQVSTHKSKDQLGSNKLLESILADKIGHEKARIVFGVIAGVYNMRNGDAHTAGSKIGEAFELAEIDTNQSYLRQGEQLIDNFARSIYFTGKLLFT
ncbi:hypothetical protein [Acinetobacter sp.]|uniref:hypothetical protein n=1 Tax=Acinetobacter sp. TaxID=472 RepID=UPI0026480E09|nr:hypothetical protein [Acinetobacter sp.]MDN5525708.1 hypothetical protein [Acinetobacter sp.]